MPLDPHSWALVVPVKRLSIAKTRLDVDPRLRADLALAMAVDTVTACVAAGADVLVVTDDERAQDAMRSSGADVEPDVPDVGLNAALAHGAQVLARHRPGTSIAAVSSDLPALTAGALSAVLDGARTLTRGCVADVSGTGTTVLTAAGIDSFVPAFGAGSWERHRAAGAVDLTYAADARVRRDVDTLADLAAAREIGCGVATSAVLSANPALVP